jgi:beta-glucanase (GH16 family)
MPPTSSTPNTKQVLAALLGLAMVAAGCSSSEDAAASSTTVQETTTTSTTQLETTTTIPTAPPIPAPDPIPAGRAGWDLVWQDEFDGDEIDLDNWTYDLGGWGWGNGEAQNYTDRHENARTENGLLVIEARKERFEDSYYTSARLKTRGLQEFQYGRFEARLKVPAGQGVWPAFWMLGANFEQDAAEEANRWPFVGEIDIMEYVGREPDLVVGTIHGPGYAGALGLTKWNRQDYDIADDWHTFAVEWDTEGVSWFYDDEIYHTLGRDAVGPNREWVFDREFFLILNLALGGTLGGIIGLDLEFPRNLYVDYVRVYQRPAE